MRYEDVAPDIGWLEQIPKTGIIKYHIIDKCWMCESMTTFVDIDFNAPLCSEECSKKAWELFINA
jgi:hypothetical protein